MKIQKVKYEYRVGLALKISEAHQDDDKPG